MHNHDNTSLIAPADIISADMGLFTSIIVFVKNRSTILYLSILYKFVIKLRLLLAAERLPRKHSKAHDLTHVLSLLRLFTKKFKNVDVIVRRPVYRYK